MPAFLAPLLQMGLRLVANAALVKGQEFIKEKTGVDLGKPSFTEEDRQKLNQFQAEHEEELLRLQLEDNKVGLEETKAYLEDIASARQNQVAIQTSGEAPWYAKAIQPTLAIITVVVTFGLFAMFVAWGGAEILMGANGQPVVDANGKAITIERMTGTQKDLVVYILGVLSAVVTQIFAYYFGSSRGSEAKNDTLTQMLDRTVKSAGANGGRPV